MKMCYITYDLYDEEIKQLHGQGDYGRSNAKAHFGVCIKQVTK